MQLNQDQTNAADAVALFLSSSDKEFILSGPAGTGKTFMMKHIMNNSFDEYADVCKLMGIKHTPFEVHLTATTNKAAEVLAVSTGYKTTTIHSLLSLKVKDDYKTGKSNLVKTANWRVFSNAVIFVDEASMVDAKLHELLKEATDNTCKIIYIGDHCQMAPVFEKISPVYLNQKHFVELKTPVRNAGQPALMALCSQLRETVETGVFKPINEVKGVIETADDSDMQYILKNFYNDPLVDSRILCFTNSRVQEFNNYIRGIRGYPDHFTKDEILINNSALHMKKEVLKIEREFQIIDIDSNITEVNVDDNDPKVILETYNARVRDLQENIDYDMKIPANYNHFKDLIKFYGKNKRYVEMYNLKNNYPDLRQKDACTVYKAQGSTYDFVVIDLGNIGKCNSPDQVARMLYVAASRAKNRIFFYGELPPKYLGG